MTCNIVFAGGSCGATMIRAGQKLTDLCDQEGLRVHVQYLDLWTTDFIRPNVRLVVEMFPYYHGLPIPVFNGRPFLSRSGEDELLAKLVAAIKEISAHET